MDGEGGLIYVVMEQPLFPLTSLSIVSSNFNIMFRPTDSIKM